MSRHNSNFSDPVGLVLRMLSSGHKAAYGALFREGLRLLATPLDLLLRLKDRRLIRNANDSGAAPILIVGPPRSGTTLVYQVLSQALDVSFPSNLSSIFPRSPITVTRLGRKFLSPSKSFDSFYGQTARMADCNDAFHIWNRWLGDDRYEATVDLPEADSRDLQRFLNAWSEAMGKPFLNKNNRNATAVDVLHRSLPDARFVVVDRNPIFIVQSLILAREKVQGDRKTAWGLHAESTNDSEDDLSYVDAVCRQVLAIQARMEEQLALLPGGNLFRLDYERFCARPADCVKELAQQFELNLHDDVDRLTPFEASRTLKLSQEEIERVEQFFPRAAEQPTLQTASI